ncbi:MAG: glycine betaine/proline transport system permease protein [Puniceicoccaceae bacterium 5H]|nr:MAG: glycine betaine/proline transport system permease protein [Puniceicoccaceae bacterium 5H]
MQIPVGEYFDAFITWILNHGKGFFDVLSSVLGFVIGVLENILLLNHALLYPAVVFALIVLVFVGFAFKKQLGKASWIVAAVLIVIFGVAEVFRYQTLERKYTPEEAQAQVEALDQFSADLEAQAPENYDNVVSALEQLQDSMPQGDGEALEDARREVGNSLRRMERMRPGRFDSTADEIEDVLTALAPVEGAPEDAVEQLQTLESRFRAYSLIEETQRMSRTLGRVDEPELRMNVVNERTYDRYNELLGVGSGVFERDGLPEDLRERLDTISSDFKQLNPRVLTWYPWAIVIVLMTLMAARFSSIGLGIFTALGMLLVVSMGLWYETMESLALVLAATFFALLIGIPAGVLSAKNKGVDSVVRPILDFMQTMPAFVYLIPAVMLFGLGKVPALMATLIFAMPPAVRLTSLGIRQVPHEVVEAAQAFGSTPWQMLVKAQLPIALPTILAGLNQTIMLALSMVVIGGMIGAGGLGEVVLQGITQLKIGLGFEGGLGVVILAIFLDRLTQAFGKKR